MNNWSYSNPISQSNRILTRRSNQYVKPLKLKQSNSKRLFTSVRNQKVELSHRDVIVSENDPKTSFLSKPRVIKKEGRVYSTNKSLVKLKTKPPACLNGRKDNLNSYSNTKSYRKISTDGALLENLTHYEKLEVLQYPEVYYTGNPTKKHQLTKMKSLNFQDNNGYYKLTPGDHISYRYEIYSVLGKGSFGQVCHAYDHKRNKEVAVKILKSDMNIAKQGLSEISMLEYLRTGHPRVIQILNSFTFRNHICIAFELLQSSLYDLLRHNSFTGISVPLIKILGKQILHGLIYLREKCIIHCDLKPENILLTSLVKADVKIIDFGSSCFMHRKVFTYIQSRYYRAPEIVLGLPYSFPIDMWSLACILYELAVGHPLFSSHTEPELLRKLITVIGSPPLYVLPLASKKAKYTEILKKMGVPEPCLPELLQNFPPDLSDFIQNCLTWDSSTRPSPAEALSYSFFN